MPASAANPVRTIARSVCMAAPIIAVMFILGTSSVLALVPIDQIDLIAPIPQVLSVGLRPARVGGCGGAAHDPRAARASAIAQASVMFTGNTRLPMVAGWDGLLPRWFTGCTERYRTPVNSIVFVGVITFVFSIAGLIGVGKQEGVSAAVERVGDLLRADLSRDVRDSARGPRKAVSRPPLWLKVAALSGFLMTLLYVGALDSADRERHEPDWPSRSRSRRSSPSPTRSVRRSTGTPAAPPIYGAKPRPSGLASRRRSAPTRTGRSRQQAGNGEDSVVRTILLSARTAMLKNN